jgi:hypothetical protein
MSNPQPGGSGYPSSSGSYPLTCPDPTSRYATAGIALRVSGALKPHPHDKVETPSVGMDPILGQLKPVRASR